jgi:hypothetical protein
MTEAEDLRAATREAHEAMKDMKLLMRDARCLINDIHEAAYQEVNSIVGTFVREGMEAHNKAIEDAIEDATNLVYRRFAEIGDVLMGEDRGSKKSGSAIKKLAEQWVAERSAVDQP